jgi:hypothetical protein
MLPPLAEPLDEAFAVVAGATYCYKWSCDASRCPDFHQQDSTPHMAPMVVYNSTPEGLIGGGPDGGIWGWHHVRNPIHGDLNKHKPGLLSTAAGAVIGLAINTGHKLVAEEPVAGEQALLKLFYLTSYERMGMVSLSCEGGCKCNPKTVDSHTTVHESVVKVARMAVSQSANCTLRVEVLRETRDPNGGHKFKIVQINVTPPQTAASQILTHDHAREKKIIEDFKLEAGW